MRTNSQKSGSNRSRKDRLLLLSSRIRNKKPNQLVRVIFTKAPPFTLFGKIFYATIFDTKVYDLINKKAKSLYQTCNLKLDSIQLKILAELNNNGIATLHIDDLILKKKLFENLNNSTHSLKASKAESLKGQTFYNHKIRGIGRNINGKIIPEPYLDLFLSDKLLTIVNAYFGQWSRLNYIDSWYTLEVSDDDLFASTELWHRDHEDKRVIKIFLYLSDVTDDAGPFAYIMGTHSKGQNKFAWLPPADPPKGAMSLT